MLVALTSQFNNKTSIGMNYLMTVVKHNKNNKHTTQINYLSEFIESKTIHHQAEFSKHNYLRDLADQAIYSTLDFKFGKQHWQSLR